MSSLTTEIWNVLEDVRNAFASIASNIVKASPYEKRRARLQKIDTHQKNQSSYLQELQFNCEKLDMSESKDADHSSQLEALQLHFQELQFSFEELKDDSHSSKFEALESQFQTDFQTNQTNFSERIAGRLTDMRKGIKKINGSINKIKKRPSNTPQAHEKGKKKVGLSDEIVTLGQFACPAILFILMMIRIIFLNRKLISCGVVLDGKVDETEFDEIKDQVSEMKIGQRWITLTLKGRLKNLESLVNPFRSRVEELTKIKQSWHHERDEQSKRDHSLSERLEKLEESASVRAFPCSDEEKAKLEKILSQPDLAERVAQSYVSERPSPDEEASKISGVPIADKTIEDHMDKLAMASNERDQRRKNELDSIKLTQGKKYQEWSKKCDSEEKSVRGQISRNDVQNNQEFERVRAKSEKKYDELTSKFSSDIKTIVNDLSETTPTEDFESMDLEKLLAPPSKPYMEKKLQEPNKESMEVKNEWKRKQETIQSLVEQIKALEESQETEETSESLIEPIEASEESRPHATVVRVDSTWISNSNSA